MTRRSPHTVLVVGTGLIGTSVALALSARGVAVLLDDKNPAALAIAVSRHAGVATSASDIPDLVVVCVPPESVPTVAADALVRYPNATVTDVSSVKSAPLTKLARLSVDAARFVGGHPMAGLEISGPDAGRADLFQDRLWAITATEQTDSDRIQDVEWLARQCGAVVVHVDPARHDHAVALTSHTPQVLSSVLAGQLVDADEQDIALSGQGLRDVTRLAASMPDLWAEILAGNSAEVAAVLRRVEADIGDVASALDQPEVDSTEIVNMLRRGNDGRAVLPDKHGGQAHQYETIHVVVDDKPGELGRLFVAAGEASVNLEDVRIEHTVGRMRAIVELDVTPSSAGRLRDALTAGEWTLRS